MGLFKRRIDLKNATKTTYSEDDLKKLDMNHLREYVPQGEKRIYTPFRKETPGAWKTQMRDQAFEKILDDHLFTFKHLLVIPNPYGVAVQTALLLFNTSKTCKVRYRVLGKQEGCDYCAETAYNTRHRVPVVGLYKGYTNKLILELIDEQGEVFSRRDLRIYARDIALNQQNIVTKVEHQKASHFPFTVINGINFNPIALDQMGEVRYALQLKTNKMGMIPLEQGHFLYADTTISRAGKNGHPVSCQYHEMDYMGRIYKTYLMEYPIGQAVCQKEDALFVVSASDAEHEGDCILEIDRRNGQIVRRCDLADMLGDRYRDRKTWTPVSDMKICADGLLLTLKRLHTVLLYDWTAQEVIWVMGPQEIWEGSRLQDKLLKEAPDQKWITLVPENTQYQWKDADTLDLWVYSIQNRGTLSVSSIAKSLDSRIAGYRLDLKGRTFTQLRDLDMIKSKRFINAIYEQEDQRILSLSGMLDRRSEYLKSCLEEIDSHTSDVINRLRLCKTFRGGWSFAPDIVDCAKPLEKELDVIYGALNPPQEYTGTLPAPTNEKLKRKVFGNTRVYGDLFVFAFCPGTVRNVYLVGEKHAYVQDFSGLISKRRKENFSIALDALACDEYQVYVEYDGKIYQLKNEIRIEKRK